MTQRQSFSGLRPMLCDPDTYVYGLSDIDDYAIPMQEIYAALAEIRKHRKGDDV